MARRTKKQIMAGVDCIESRIVDYNTVEYRRENGDRVIRLHLTDIVTFRPGGKIVLNSGGWKTITTKTRMNDQIGPWHIWQEKNEWYLARGYRFDDPAREHYHYHDGIVLDGDSCDGKLYDKALIKERNKYRRRVKAYAADFIAALREGNVPPPGAGDCWLCSMIDKDDVSWGEHSRNDDHVRSHIEEKYYVPSLLMRAIKRHPVAPVAEWCLGHVWQDGPDPGENMGGIGYDQLQKSLYRYCLQYAT